MRHPGHKPQFKKVNQERKSPEIDERVERERVQRELLAEWSDDDWEKEPRAQEPASGRAMDGDDVGFTPLRRIVLPQSQVPASAMGMHGRSMYVSDWTIPSDNPKQETSSDNLKQETPSDNLKQETPSDNLKQETPS